MHELYYREDPMANSRHLALLKRGVSLWNAWRSEHPGILPDLTNADLAGMDLKGANLSLSRLVMADLRGTSLIQADLIGTFAMGADFSNACLVGANLSTGNFTDSNLQHADMRGSVLIFTNFTIADLSMARLDSARLARTIFANSALTNTTGLARAIHWGPSVVDYGTILRTGSFPPRRFLRGCGIPDGLVDLYEAVYQGDSEPYCSCFISYSHADRSFARRLHDALQDRGVRCWLDEHQISPGDDIYERSNGRTTAGATLVDLRFAVQAELHRDPFSQSH